MDCHGFCHSSCDKRVSFLDSGQSAAQFKLLVNDQRCAVYYKKGKTWKASVAIDISFCWFFVCKYWILCISLRVWAFTLLFILLFHQTRFKVFILHRTYSAILEILTALWTVRADSMASKTVQISLNFIVFLTYSTKSITVYKGLFILLFSNEMSGYC